MLSASLVRPSLLHRISFVATLLGVSLATIKDGWTQKLAVAPRPQKSVQLFDGKSLQGWAGDTRYWSVENGAIVGSTHPDGITKNTFLVADHVYEDFELQLQFKLSNHASGIQIRSQVPDPRKAFYGYRLSGGYWGWGHWDFLRGAGQRQSSRC